MWILAAALLPLYFSGAGTELGHMKPAELILVDVENPFVIIKTDLGDEGKGSSFQEAAENMQEKSDGILFLDTAEKIVVSEKALYLLPELEDIFRPAAEVYLGSGAIKPDQAAEYLSARKGNVTLGMLKTGKGRLPVLLAEKGRYHLVR